MLSVKNKLIVNQVCFEYPEQRVLDKVSFYCAPGQLVYLKGANGSGKTTLLRIIAGLLTPSEGYVEHEAPTSITYIGHKLGISRVLTVWENIRDLVYTHHAWDEGFQEIHRVLDALKLTSFMDTPCHLLSAGQQRRVALLRLWLTRDPLWLLDEPLTALDQASITILFQRIETHLAQQGMVIMSSHQTIPLQNNRVQEYFLV